MNKKKLLLLLIPIVLILVIVIIFLIQRTKVEFYETDDGTAVSIIGGADGPTSVFIAGKLGDGGKDEYMSITMDAAKTIFEVPGNYIIEFGGILDWTGEIEK